MTIEEMGEILIHFTMNDYEIPPVSYKELLEDMKSWARNSLSGNLHYILEAAKCPPASIMEHSADLMSDWEVTVAEILVGHLSSEYALQSVAACYL